MAIGALAGLPAGAQAASPLIGQWSLDASHEDGASQVTADSSGNGLDLRASNGSVHLGTPARFGTGATLGTDLTPLQITSPLLAPAQLTLLAWIRQSGNPGTLRYIAGRGDDGLTCGGSTYAIYTGYPGKPGLRFYVRTGVSASSLTDAPLDTAVFDGGWHLVAGTYDGAAARLYVDGALVGPPIAAPPPLTYALSGASSFYVDGYPVEGCALFGNADDWPGAIDEVRLYDRALSASELGRLAAAGGPTTPDLVTDASLAAPAPPAPPAPPPAGAEAGAQPSTKAVQSAALAQAAAGMTGASKNSPTAAMQAALTAAQAQALGAMKSAAGSSQIAEAQAAAGLTSKQAQQTKPDPRIQERLEAMKYGIAAQLPVTAPGQIVEAVASIAVEKKSNGKVKTQTIVLPPAVGAAQAGSGKAQLEFAVDNKATAAMTKSDIAKAAISVQAVTIDSLSDLSMEQQQRMQTYMDAYAKTAATLTNVLTKLSDTQQAITQNLKGGVTSSERDQQKELAAKAAKLDKQAKAIEQQRDAANQKAAEAMQQAVTNLVEGIAAGTAPVNAGITGTKLPASSASLSGCTTCRLAAVASK
ncbi:MAG TPA: LamG domain-containing protein [Baekduia sp.]|nr:LamG domain-containing protein [Baekduia sp.]